METVEKVKTNIDAVVAANRRTAEEGVVTLQRELARERQARQEADVVLEQTTLALDELRKQHVVMTEMQQELQAAVSQMRDELAERDRELAALKPGHKPALWAQPRTVDDLGRPTYDGIVARLAERDAQLAEAVEIVRELRDALAGAAETGALPPAPRATCPACGYSADGRPARGGADDGATVFSDLHDNITSASGSDMRTPTPGLPPAPMRHVPTASGAPPMFWVSKAESSLTWLPGVLSKAASGISKAAK